MKTTIVITVLGLFVAAAANSAMTAPPEGKGPAGHGRGGGRGMPAEARDSIHTLFANHEKVTRKVQLTKRGYKAKTTSKDPKIAATLQKHVGQMKERLDGGRPVRRWDPAFAEFFEHYKDLKTTIKKIDGGIEVKVVGKTEAAVKVARNHAKIISGFVKKGDEQHHATHEAALKKSGKSPKAEGGPKSKTRQAGPGGKNQPGCGKQCEKKCCASQKRGSKTGQ